jgi:hypothetical protein
MDEALLNQIVARVLAELKKASCNGQLESKKKLLILSDNPEKLQVKFEEISQEFGSEYVLYALQEADSPLPFGIEGIEVCQVKRVKWDRVYLAECSVNSLVKISLGLREGVTAELVGIALTKGTPVEMENPSFGFTPMTQEGYRRLLEGYLKQVVSFGVVLRGAVKSALPILGLPAIQEHLSANFSGASPALPAIPVTPATREVHRHEKRLLSEREVNKVPANSLLLVNSGAIITPLAKDVLKSRNIEVRQAEEG